MKAPDLFSNIKESMPNPAGRRVKNVKTGEEGHVWGIECINPDREYWFRTCKREGMGYSGRFVSGKDLIIKLSTSE